MRTRSIPTSRSAFTLLEMVLAAAVAVLLLAALYVAMDLQLRHAESAREVVTETTLARTLLNRIAADIAPDLATADPARYKTGGGSGGGASGGGSGSAATTGNTVSNTDGTLNTFGSTNGTDATASASGLAVLALQGSSSSLTLYVSRVPPGASGSNGPTQPAGFSDQRRIVYWLVEGAGLARQELTAVTSEDAMNGNVPSGMPSDPKQLIAKEVQSLQFQYFDGTNWQDSWDGAQVGPDGVTPIGPPLAVAITIGIVSEDGIDTKTYRHVAAIPTANSQSSLQAQNSNNSNSGSSGSGSSGSGSSGSGSSGGGAAGSGSSGGASKTP
jgi:uncharacterized membrane protein YgcG